MFNRHILYIDRSIIAKKNKNKIKREILDIRLTKKNLIK
jgi:hypothetical protein